MLDNRIMPQHISIALYMVLGSLVIATPALARQPVVPAAEPPDSSDSDDTTGLEPSAGTLPEPAPTAKRVVVFPVAGTLTGNLASAPEEFTTVILGATEARATGAERSTAPFADVTALIGCDPQAAPCQLRLLDELDRDELIFAEVQTALDQGTPTLALSATRVVRGQQPIQETFTLPASSVEEAKEALSRQIPVLFGEEPMPEPDGQNDQGGGGVKTYSWIVLGSGGALVLTGLSLWGVTASKQGAISDAPTTTVDDLNDLESQENSARLTANLGNAFVAVGAITTAVGIYLILKQRGAGTAEEPMRITPTPLEGGAGLTFTMGW